MDLTGAAKVTNCNHFFHGKCLRKWLYVTDSCPLCYGALYEDKDKQESNKNDQVNRTPIVAPNDAHEGLIDNDHAMERPIDDSEENNSSSSSDDDSSEASIAQSSGDINGLPEDAESLGSDNDDSQDNDEASWSCTDEDDDLLYDSMDDCRRNIHSENTSPSETICSNENCTETTTIVNEYLNKSLPCVSTIDLNTSQFSNTPESSNINQKREDLQIDHMLPVLEHKCDNSQDNVNGSDNNS